MFLFWTHGHLRLGHDYALWIRNLMVMMKNSKTSILRLGPMAHGHNPAKVPKFKYKYDGILSIGNLMLIINNNFALLSCPVTCEKPKKIAPYFRGNTEFPIYSCW
jgi:hypothetical protein